MRFIFEDEAFALEALRTAGLAGDGGSDIGEVLATLDGIDDGDESGWLAAWQATAVRIAREGEESLASGDPVSAREAFFRASSYYRCADFFRADSFRGDDPAGDVRLLGLSRCARDYFFRAAELLDGPFREVGIPYEGGELPGYLFLVDDDGTPRPTIVYTNGFESTREDAYFALGAAALRRGYNFLAYDGPGQGAMIREKGMPYRSDWENVLGPVVDYALTVPEIDDRRIVQFGHGLGSYLVARYATRDHRSAVIVCDDGMTTFYACRPQIPEPVLDLIEDGRDDEAIPMLDVLMKDDSNVRWGLQHGRWTFGARTVAEYVRRTAEFGVTAGDVGRIRTQALILEADGATAFAGQAANFALAMTAPVHHVVLRDADGVRGAPMQQAVFNHLAETLRY